MPGILKLVHSRGQAGAQRVEIDGDDTIEHLLRDLQAGGPVHEDLADRAVVCIRELVQQRNFAADHLKVSVSLLNQTLAKLDLLRERIGRRMP